MLRSVLVLALAGSAAGCCCMGGAGADSARAGSDRAVRAGNVQHVVFFKFKDGLPPGKVEEVVAEFRKLPARVPGIVAFQDGRDMSPEGLQKGFTHVFLVTFADAAARDRYLPHPAHEAFKQVAVPAIADVCVLDFVVSDSSGEAPAR